MRRTTRNITVTGPAAYVLFAIYAAWFIWCIYFLIKVAAHVGAWPF